MLISWSASVGLLALLIGPISAQEQDPDPSPSADQGAYARVAAPRVDLRVFPTDNSPIYGDAVTQGAGVLVGESYGEFRQVVLPLGPVGFVHKKFCSAPEDGKLITIGADVSYRYRPQSGEAPVELLPEGTELYVVGEEGDWWEVRLPGGQAWASLDELQMLDSPSETLVKSYAELGEQHRKVVEEIEAERVQALAEAQFLAELQARLDAVKLLYTEEASLPTTEQNYAAVEADLNTLIEELPEDSAVLVNAELLAVQVETRKRVVEATQVIRAEPVPAVIDPKTVAPKTVADPLARFDAVGWLRFRSSSGGMDRFVVEKGGQTLFWVTCSTGRYDLSLFDGVEVGLTGGKDRPSRESMRVVDVEKLEVLGLGQ